MMSVNADTRPARAWLPVLALVAAALLVAGCGKEEKKEAARPPVEVTTLAIVPRDVSVVPVYVAQTQSSQAVNIQARVSGFLDKRVYTELSTEHPIDLTRYQVANCYMGRAGLINSGGASGENDFAEAVKTAVINKRAGGMGLISGRKAFQRPLAEGVKLLNAIQDVYLCKDVTVA